MFTDEEISGFYGIKNKKYFTELSCGCTVAKYGDTAGKLRIYEDGRIEVDCECIENCSEVRISPIEFAKHAGRSNSHTNWKSQIWVFKADGQKVSLSKTCLLKYHMDTFQRPLRGVIHRDEFVRCSQCNKDRRFTRRNEEDCRMYHDAILDKNWKCSDMQNFTLTCNDAEERDSRKVFRSCPKSVKCKGCTNCICLSCDMCCFEDCNCRTCHEFYEKK